jgi:hypothetical protein
MSGGCSNARQTNDARVNAQLVRIFFQFRALGRLCTIHALPLFLILAVADVATLFSKYSCPYNVLTNFFMIRFSVTEIILKVSIN